jgi:hypothetical protein
MENVELHTTQQQKDNITDQFKTVKDEILKNAKHQDVYHVSEKQVDSVAGAVNANTMHRTDKDSHFDSKAQKESVINFMTTTVPMGMGGGAGSAHTESFLDLTDTPSTMGTTNQILAVTAGGVLAFTSNPIFAASRSSTSHKVGTASSGNGVLINANGTTLNYGTSTWGTNNASIDVNGNVYGFSLYSSGDVACGGFHYGKHKAANGSAGSNTDIPIYYGDTLYIDDGLVTGYYHYEP